MMFRDGLMLTLVVMLVGLVTGAAGAPRASLPTLRVPDGLGVNIHFTDARPGEMQMLVAAGFRWVRMDFAWNSIEREPGVYDFSAYDRLMADLDAHGIRAMFIFDYSHPRYDNDLSPHSDEGRAAFARWAAASVKHFQGRGILWEMYNEPNIQFWRPEPKAADYIKLALAVGKAIRGAAPGELYCGPATSTFDWAFLEACFKAGLLQFWDAVTVHPYRAKIPETTIDNYRALRLMIARYAPRGKRIPIVDGEWGYTDVATGLNGTLQGKYLARKFLMNLANDVPVSIWYDWHDDGTDPKEGEHHFGTVAFPYHDDRDPVYDPKPAYLASRALATQLRGFRFNKSLACGGPRDHVVLFTRGKDVRVVAWSETAEPHSVTVPASPGAFRAVSWSGEVLPSVRAGAAGLRVPLTDAPTYLTPERPNDVLRVAAAWDRAPLEVVCSREPVRIATRLRNPLAAAVRVSTPGSGSASVAPEGVLRVTHTLDPHGDIEPRQARVALDLRIGQRTFALRQPVSVVAERPLALRLEPASDAADLIVENPTRAAFSGTLRLSGRRTVVPIRVSEGETETSARVALAAAPGQARHVSAVLADAAGVPVAKLSTRVVPVETGEINRDVQPTGLTVTPDGQPAVPVEHALSGGPSPEISNAPSPKAYRLRYKMGKGERFLRVEIGPEFRKPLPGKPRWFGLWIYSDGNKNYPRMRYLDATGQQFQTDGTRMSWKGWRYLRFSLDPADATHSGGANDGAAHYPLTIEAPLVMWNGHGRAVEGEVWLACPTVLY